MSTSLRLNKHKLTQSCARSCRLSIKIGEHKIRLAVLANTHLKKLLAFYDIALALLRLQEEHFYVVQGM